MSISDGQGNAPSPIEWMLLTTVEVTSYDDAQKRIEWYSGRWGIEFYLTLCPFRTWRLDWRRQMNQPEFAALGKKITAPSRTLETFPKPAGVERVILESDEVTSLCPVTGQPDWETVTIEFAPEKYCIESKSLKLYLWSFREEGIFCEALASQIAKDIYAACKPRWCRVTVVQKPRGGVKITATALAGDKEASQ